MLLQMDKVIATDVASDFGAVENRRKFEMKGSGVRMSWTTFTMRYRPGQPVRTRLDSEPEEA